MFFNQTELLTAGVETTKMDSQANNAVCLFTKGKDKDEKIVNTTSEGQGEYHVPVLLNETLHYMAPSNGKVIVDATLGGGGHTEAMLLAGATVLGVDQDEEALCFACDRLKPFGDRFQPLYGNFSILPELLENKGIEKVDGILADIGVSSWQLDAAKRGFSFRQEGPLDMRMNCSTGQTAADIVNQYSEQELRTIFYEYGEERASRKMACRIVEQRKVKPFLTTLDLADFISTFIPRGGKSHPATRIFQALRIEVNNELGVLKSFLENSPSLLHPAGRLGVITFHSLEDRIVKQFLKKSSMAEIDRKEWPAPRPNPEYHYKILTRRPVIASGDELKRNKRSRSAKLRVVEKI